MMRSSSGTYSFESLFFHRWKNNHWWKNKLLVEKITGQLAQEARRKVLLENNGIYWNLLKIHWDLLKFIGIYCDLLKSIENLLKFIEIY